MGKWTLAIAFLIYQFARQHPWWFLGIWGSLIVIGVITNP